MYWSCCDGREYGVNSAAEVDDSVAGVVEHVRRVVDDPRVEVRIVGAFQAEPSPVSSSESDSFRKLERTIRSFAPDAIVAPYLVVVATDSRPVAVLLETGLAVKAASGSSRVPHGEGRVSNPPGNEVDVGDSGVSQPRCSSPRPAS